MYISTLSLKNFRNQKSKDIEFSPHLNLIVGNNGSGKTTIIESIHSISTTRSFKAKKEIDVISYNQDFSKILLTKDNLQELSIVYTKINDTRVKKQYLVSNVSKRMNSFIGESISVLFTTDLVNSFTQLSSTRRSFFNQFLSQLNKEYLSHLSVYEKVIRNKNKLLKMVREGADRKLLDYWNQELVQSGSYLIFERKNFINELKKYFTNLSGIEKRVEIEYLSKYIEQKNINEIKEKLLSDLTQYTQIEIAASRSIVGPHRDDYELYLNEKNIKNFASRGEQKFSISFILFAIAMYIQNVKNDSPVILLDDLSAEMDEKNIEHILKLFLETKFQIIATAINELQYIKHADRIIRLS